MAGDDPADTLWTQFNRIAFPQVEYGERSAASDEMDLADAGDEEGEIPGDTVSESPYFNLKHNLEAFSTVGLRTEHFFDDLRVQYARIDLPDFRYRWRTGALKTLTTEFTKTVLEEETSSHLVFLVGPYGTGKTSTAQVLTHALTDKTDWFILAYHPEARAFQFDWLTKEDSAETFRRHELSDCWPE